MHKESYDSASYYFDEGLKKYKEVRDVEGVTEIYRNLGELNLRQGNYRKGLENLDEAIELATPHQFKEYLVESYNLKSQAYEKLGRYEESLEYHQMFKELSDSIFTAEKDQALYAYQISQEHESEMADLNRQNQLQSERLKSAKFKNFLLVAISIFSLLVMLILTYYFMHKHKTGMQLKYQNYEIVNQKKEIDGQKKVLSRINKDLQHKNISLNQLNKEKDYLLHVVAHDLKGPLNQMSGLSQIIKLESANLSDNQLNCLEKIDTVSSRLSSMVDKILDIDAIEKKSNNLSLEEIDLREILDETVEDFENVAKDKKIKIHTNLNGSTSPVKVDRQHMLQVFENLLSNAIKFSPPNRDVYINIKEETEEVITEVKDEGPGLTEDDKQRVFQKFQKLSAQPTANEGSNGLGLSIVKKYVEAMNGKVWVESILGKGASFKVAFKKI
jgi:signal transduction histidine kinase